MVQGSNWAKLYVYIYIDNIWKYMIIVILE
jgi:hypothetical protein